jgi:hypothetical protein
VSLRGKLEDAAMAAAALIAGGSLIGCAFFVWAAPIVAVVALVVVLLRWMGVIP